MLVSVIVPNYNHGKFLKQRIDSILEQTYQNFEVIILDDCSPDNSRDIIEQYRNHKKISHIIYNEINSGSTFKQWNKGISLAKGELIWIAESDDFAEPDLLQKLKSEFDTDAELGIAYCQSNMVNEKNKVTGSWKFWTEDLDAELFEKGFKMSGKEYVEKFILYKNTIPNASAVLFKKNLYEMIGGADINILKCSDWITWIKMLLISKIVFIPEPVNNYRYHENSVIAMAKKNMGDEYVGKYQAFMRISLQNFLQTKVSKDITLKPILKKNHQLFLQEDIKEGIFYLNNKNRIKGISKIIKTGFSSINTFLFVVKIILNKSINIIKGVSR